MTSKTKVAMGGVALGVIALWLIPGWILTLLVLGAIAVPVAAYLMLDPSQRRKVRARGRKRLGA
ncbi:hypothetical protein [Thermomonospora umbrina]|uniref:hypothetical protein n=1 Tax=Thermomonospora umbrina TaxID=111806 RepID=UPI000E255CC5|nr:hypothetical protein [Thermomonospora umbrina]